MNIRHSVSFATARDLHVRNQSMPRSYTTMKSKIVFKEIIPDVTVSMNENRPAPQVKTINENLDTILQEARTKLRTLLVGQENEALPRRSSDEVASVVKKMVEKMGTILQETPSKLRNSGGVQSTEVVNNKYADEAALLVIQRLSVILLEAIPKIQDPKRASSVVDVRNSKYSVWNLGSQTNASEYCEECQATITNAGIFCIRSNATHEKIVFPLVALHKLLRHQSFGEPQSSNRIDKQKIYGILGPKYILK